MKKIVLNVDDVLPIVAQVTSVVAAKNLFPILGDIIIWSFSRDGGVHVVFSASDSEQWLSMLADVVEGDVDFKVAVNASDFLRIIDGLKGFVITLELSEDGKIMSIKYDNGAFEIPVDDQNDFPKPNVTTGDKIDIVTDSSNLAEAIANTEFATAKEIVRPIMNNIHFDIFEDRFVSVAVNNMTLAKHSGTSIKTGTDKTASINMPSKTAKTILQLLKKTEGLVMMSFNSNNVKVYNGTFKYTSRLFEGNYPDYNRLLNFTPSFSITASKNAIINALRRLVQVRNDVMVFTFSDGIINISSEDVSMTKSAYEEVACDYNGEQRVIAFNGDVLSTALSKIQSENVVLKYTDETRPMLISPETQGENTEYIMLIMPIKLNG